MFVLVDIGCRDCGETSNVVGIFTSKEKAKEAKVEYEKVNRLEGNDDHELLIYQIKEVDKIYNDSFEHLVE